MNRTPHNKLQIGEYIGRTFGRLTILSCEGRVGQTYNMKVKCSCGVVKTVRLTALKSGHTQSCGCIIKEELRARNTTHGLRYHRLYSVWRNMIARCYKPSHKNYNDYGGRGIKVCLQWKSNFQTFFDWCISNGWKEDLELDRFPNNDGNYEPKNVRFVPSKINNRNRRSNQLVTYNGETRCIQEWSEVLGINQMTLRNRLKNSSVEVAFSRPVREGNYKRTA